MSNEKVIWDWLMEKFGNQYGVAGLMGNLQAESGLNPQNLQGTYEKRLGMTDLEYTKKVDNGTYTNFVKDSAGYGIAQWTYWSRKQNLLDFAKKRNKSIGDLSMQLEFLYQELTTSFPQVVNTLKTATSVEEASNAVLLKFERPANQSKENQKRRASMGETFYNKYANKGVTPMGNSPLVNYTKLSPNHSGKRNHVIDTISIHCMAGNLSIETCGKLFANPDRKASSNYGIGSDGRIGLYVEEKNRSWCTSSSSNDNRAITIEVANSVAKHPWPVSDAAYKSLINLLVDICQRNNIKKLLWKGDKDLIGQVDKQNMTVHRWFANKACPGDWLYERHGQIAKEVNARLSGIQQMQINPTIDVNYKARVDAKIGLNCRSNPDSNSSIVKTYPEGTILTISKEYKEFRYTGEGWVLSTYISKIPAITNNIEEEEEMTQEKFNQMMDNYMKDLALKNTTWAQEYLTWGEKNGILKGNENGHMMPLKFCSRQEAVVMLKRLYDLIKSEK